MAYTIEIADAVARTVGKFVTLNTYQLAGHIANIDFWVQQVRNALEVIDGYEKRQRILEQAQKKHIQAHKTQWFNVENAVLHREFPDDPWYQSTDAMPDRWRIEADVLKSKRREVADAFYHFVHRSYKENLIDKTRSKDLLEKCGIGMEPGDFLER